MIGTVGKVFEKNISTIKHISRWRMRWVGQFITSVLELQENKESQKLCQNFSLLQVPLTKLWSRMLMIVKAGYKILIYCYQGRLIIKYVQLIKKIRLVVVSLHKHLLSNLSLPHPKCHVKCQKAPPIIHGQLLLFLVANVHKATKTACSMRKLAVTCSQSVKKISPGCKNVLVMVGQLYSSDVTCPSWRY